MKKRIIALLMVIILCFASGISSYAGFYNVASEYDGLATSIRNNCVLFARYKVPSLPYGLTSYESKKNICNSYTPAAGSIAVMPSSNLPQYGHVAYVEAVNGDTITIIEGGVRNKYDGVYHINRRSGTASSLEIYGYYNPGGSSSGNVHTHNFYYIGREALHPHKVYRECACGVTEYTGETKYLSECTQCNPIVNLVSVSTTEAKNITSSNAVVYGQVSYSGNRPSEVGIYFGTSASNMSKVAKDSIGHNKNPFDMWYDLNAEAGQYLNPGTTYYWQCYAIVDGAEYTGFKKSFTTEAETSQAPVSNTFTAYAINTDGTLAINSIPKAGYQIGSIPEGAACTVYPDQTSGNWYWVSYNGVSGYSYSKYLTTNPPGNNTPVNNAPISSAEYIHPVPDGWRSQAFSGGHQAVDIAANEWTPIYAIKAGTVNYVYTGCVNKGGASSKGIPCSSLGKCNPHKNGSYKGYNGGYCNEKCGNGVIIRHDGDIWSEYSHMVAVADGIYAGQYVEQGTLIGYVGNTGFSAGNHCHFAMASGSNSNYWRNARLNPLDYISIN